MEQDDQSTGSLTSSNPFDHAAEEVLLAEKLVKIARQNMIKLLEDFKSESLELRKMKEERT